MDMKPLPIRSSLEQYEKQAEEFLDAHRSGDSEAMRCMRRYHPYLPGRGGFCCARQADGLGDSKRNV